ncbi:MAG: YvcK family protein [Blastocatellia bacterium]|nr:YvcK family protein [Blastocatellia bacterium]MBK6428643.1 YvcK family protein [Blastocatellia bacterium]
MAIGGGTGLSTLLGGLKQHVDVEIGPPGDGLTAIVTVTDNGGSSGRLREEFNILPPGDIRNCMVALAEDEQLLTRLFRYRFAGEGTLGGHSFGNLFLTALTDVTGDFLEAIRVSSEVLAIQGKIVPSTMEVVDLIADLADGRTVCGEREIATSGSRVRRIRLSRADCRPLDATIEAIASADLIVLGPGSLFSSVIPNLLVPGIPEAITTSPAPVLFVCNGMTQPGETDGFTVEDHLDTLVQHAPALRVDQVLVNTHPISESLRRRYLAEGSIQVRLGFGDNSAVPPSQDRDVWLSGHDTNPTRITGLDVIDDRDVVRHDARKLARVVLDTATAARHRLAVS